MPNYLEYNICSNHFIRDFTREDFHHLYYGSDFCECEPGTNINQCEPRVQCNSKRIKDEIFGPLINSSYECVAVCDKVDDLCTCECQTISKCDEFDCCLCKLDEMGSMAIYDTYQLIRPYVSEMCDECCDNIIPPRPPDNIDFPEQERTEDPPTVDECAHLEYLFNQDPLYNYCHCERQPTEDRNQYFYRKLYDFINNHPKCSMTADYDSLFGHNSAAERSNLSLKFGDGFDCEPGTILEFRDDDFVIDDDDPIIKECHLVNDRCDATLGYAPHCKPTPVVPDIPEIEHFLGERGNAFVQENIEFFTKFMIAQGTLLSREERDRSRCSCECKWQGPGSGGVACLSTACITDEQCRPNCGPNSQCQRHDHSASGYCVPWGYFAGPAEGEPSTEFNTFCTANVAPGYDAQGITGECCVDNNNDNNADDITNTDTFSLCGLPNNLIHQIIYRNCCKEIFGFWDSDQEVLIPGCTEERACNYNPMATVDDGSCAPDLSDVGGNAYGFDCSGVCNGKAQTDGCGLCTCHPDYSCCGLSCAPGYVCEDCECVPVNDGHEEERNRDENQADPSLQQGAYYCNPNEWAIAGGFTSIGPGGNMVSTGNSWMMDHCGVCNDNILSDWYVNYAADYIDDCENCETWWESLNYLTTLFLTGGDFGTPQELYQDIFDMFFPGPVWGQECDGCPYNSIATDTSNEEIQGGCIQLVQEFGQLTNSIYFDAYEDCVITNTDSAAQENPDINFCNFTFTDCFEYGNAYCNDIISPFCQNLNNPCSLGTVDEVSYTYTLDFGEDKSTVMVSFPVLPENTLIDTVGNLIRSGTGSCDIHTIISEYEISTYNSGNWIGSLGNILHTEGYYLTKTTLGGTCEFTFSGNPNTGTGNYSLHEGNNLVAGLNGCPYVSQQSILVEDALSEITLNSMGDVNSDTPLLTIANGRMYTYPQHQWSWEWIVENSTETDMLIEGLPTLPLTHITHGQAYWIRVSENVPTADIWNCDTIYTNPPFYNDLGIPFIFECVNDLSMCNNPGCTDSSACNYDANANVDDGSCDYLDCAGECGGDAQPDNCGICNGDCQGLPYPNNCSEEDCNGVCGGDAELDECGACDGPGIPAGECDCFGGVFDCAFECGGDATYDSCGVCNGNDDTCDEGCIDSAACNYCADCEVDIGGCQYPETNRNCAGECCVGTEPECDGAYPPDCFGECGGNAIPDACGVCGGDAVAGVPYCGGEPDDNCCDCSGKPGATHFVDCSGDPVSGCFSNDYLLIFSGATGFCYSQHMSRDIGYFPGLCLAQDTDDADDATLCANLQDDFLSCMSENKCDWKQGLWWFHPDEWGITDDSFGPIFGFETFGELKQALFSQVELESGKFPDFDCPDFSGWNCEAGDCLHAADVDGDGNFDLYCGCFAYDANISVINCDEVTGCGGWVCGDTGDCGYADECGICGGMCWTVQNPNPQTGDTTCNSPYNVCDDCGGVPNGGASVDECGICHCSWQEGDDRPIEETDSNCHENYEGAFGTGWNSDKDCFGECLGSGRLDNCGICVDTSAMPLDFYQDCAGNCNPDGTMGCRYFDCEPNAEYMPGCENICGYDDCGVCGGNNNVDTCLGNDDCLTNMMTDTAGMDCMGQCVDWSIWQNMGGIYNTMDDCDVCLPNESELRNQSCTGCTNVNSCNYDSESTIDNDNCYTNLFEDALGTNAEDWVDYGYDTQSGNHGIDCAGICGGWNILSDCEECYCEIENHPVYGSAEINMIVMRGDTNSDGRVGLEDIFYMTQNVLGKQHLNNKQLLSIDLDKDGICGIQDYLEVIKSTRNIGENSSKLSKFEINVLDDILNIFDYEILPNGKQVKVDLTKKSLINKKLTEIEIVLNNIVNKQYVKNWKKYNKGYIRLVDYQEDMQVRSGGDDGSEVLTVEDLCGDNPNFEQGSLDSCGVCDGDNMSCTGCMDPEATNYDTSADSPCNDSIPGWNTICTSLGQTGSNCCCEMPNESLPSNQFTTEISNILSSNPDLLDIYNKILEGNTSCVEMLDAINLPQASYSKEMICGVLTEMAIGNNMQCTYGDDAACIGHCTEVCGGSIPQLAICHNMHYCVCGC